MSGAGTGGGAISGARTGGGGGVGTGDGVSILRLWLAGAALG